ncbi:PEP-CTERM sorting domain-containing protein [Paucibacter sp. TC2R-5]|uniref:beta strand repeat-containing protein n=1 Tax=Paucibacter sp. TC2R-5 TaxID=2893555 RepID=UPI0021E4644B|nr:PEP-CTERM sorting domain-containing protein [Paucibacter sp. TC2R-5]MCV2360340.1 PEP-CTERM sorting domain-containing protein [Paucibacter sp. TC2R-5]
MTKPLGLSRLRLPAKSTLALSLLVAFAPGFAADKTTTVATGTEVKNTFDSVLVGNLAGDTETYNVLGAGTKMTNTFDLTIGNSGIGILNIESGGAVSNRRGMIGRLLGSIGTVNVTGKATGGGPASRWVNSDALNVGEAGTGTLNIENAGYVSSAGGDIGYYSGSNGKATVTGAGSQWSNAADLTVGRSGAGTLNIENGGVVSNFYGRVGESKDGTGTVKVTGAGSQWTNAGFLTIGNGGTGTLNIENGGSVTTNGAALGGSPGGSLTGGNGTINVTGSGSKWTNTGNLTVGASVKNTGAVLNIENGGWVTGSTGQTSIGQGTVNVSGAGSRWDTTGYLNLGTVASSKGTLNITTGGVVNSVNSIVGQNGSAGIGVVNVIGADSQWNLSNQIIIGGAFTTTGTLNIEEGGVVSAQKGIVGNATNSTGTLTVKGAGSQWNSSSTLTVGLNGTGTLNIQDSGKVTASSLNIGAKGTVNLAGGTLELPNNNAGVTLVPLSRLVWTAGTLSFTGDAVLNSALLSKTTTLGAGQTLAVGAKFSVVNASTLTLDGGTLQVKTGAVDSGGTFTWSKGTLSYTGDAALSAAGLLAKNTTLGSGKTLNVAQNLSVGSGNTLALSGGALQIASGSLDGGNFNWNQGTLGYTGNASVGAGLLASTTTLASGKALNVAKILNIGTGNTLDTHGGTLAAGTIALSGGTLQTSGGETSAGSFNWASGTLGYRGDAALGTGLLASTTTLNSTQALNVAKNLSLGAGHTLNLNGGVLSADTLTQNGTVNLGQGGQISTVGGTVNNSTVAFSGDSSVQGNFTNNGTVAGSAGTLSFMNDVNGAGSFAGNFAFKAAFNPGNSPAAFSFSGGNATFDSTSVLNMEFFGATPGTQYDQLISINTLTFNGKLNLAFDSSYVPAQGTSFALFGFNSFSGSFGTAEDGYSSIFVTGYDKSKLDFSHLSTDGTVRVAITSAVPEPETYAMLLAGLALMGAMVRRRRSAVSV